MDKTARTSPFRLHKVLACTTALFIVLFVASAKIQFTPYDNGWESVSIADGVLCITSMTPEWKELLGPQKSAPLFEIQPNWQMSWWWDHLVTQHTNTDTPAFSVWCFPLWPLIFLTGALSLLARRRESMSIGLPASKTGTSGPV